MGLYFALFKNNLKHRLESRKCSLNRFPLALLFPTVLHGYSFDFRLVKSFRTSKISTFYILLVDGASTSRRRAVNDIKVIKHDRYNRYCSHSFFTAIDQILIRSKVRVSPYLNKLSTHRQLTVDA